MRWLMVAAIASAWAMPARAQDSAADGSLQATFARWAREGRLPGVVVGRIAPGTTSVITAGVRSVETGAPVTDSTVFEIGSITKALTGTLLADMVVRGEVGLNDPVTRHLPTGWTMPAGITRGITLLDLATHTSGLPRMPADFAPGNPLDPYGDYDDAKLRRSLAATTLVTQPGEAYDYSNFGAAVLGRALAHRGGKPYEELLHERVLLPLGMRDSRFAGNGAADHRSATGYTARILPTGAWNLVAFAPAGGLRSSIGDMLKLLAAVADTSKGPLAKALALATRAHRPIHGVDSVGLGWHRLRQGTTEVVWHNGGTGGFRTFAGVNVHTGRGVVMMVNASVDWVDNIALQLDSGKFADPPTGRIAEIPLPDTTTDRYLGRYEFSPTFAIDVTRDSAGLWIQATAQPRLRILAIAPGVFAVRDVVAELTFELGPGGPANAMTLRQSGQTLNGRRVPAAR